jgi:hypothetical protein
MTATLTDILFPMAAPLAVTFSSGGYASPCSAAGAGPADIIAPLGER